MCKSIYWWLTDVYLSNEQYLSYIHDKTLGLCPTAEAHFLFRGMEGSEMVDDILEIIWSVISWYLYHLSFCISHLKAWQSNFRKHERRSTRWQYDAWTWIKPGTHLFVSNLYVALRCTPCVLEVRFHSRLFRFCGWTVVLVFGIQISASLGSFFHVW